MKRFLIFLAFTLSLLSLVSCGGEQNCEHSFISSVTKEPICIEVGEQLYTCSKCEYSYTEAIAANHNIENGFCTECKLPESTPGLKYSKNADGTYTVTGIGDCQETSISIGIYEDSYVTSIGNYAFEYCTRLTSVTIGNSVTSIGEYAFWNCTSLKSVTIPNSVKSIGECAFRDCTSLTSVTIPDSVTSIGDAAFYDCTSLTSVTIGNSVTRIGNWAFYGCNSLTSVTIGNSVTSIGSSAFRGCTSLASVTIPNSVTTIEDYAFGYCRSLTSVTIGNGVTSIGYDAFYRCTSLTSVTFENPDGWWVASSSDATSGTSITGLSDASTAAEYLRSNDGYYLRRG